MPTPPTLAVGLDQPAAVAQQPAPIPGGLEVHPWLQGYLCRNWPAALLTDLRLRDQMGRARYGVPLAANNGRNALVDAYQEALDLLVYLAQHSIEQELEVGDFSRETLAKVVELANDLRRQLNEAG